MPFPEPRQIKKPRLSLSCIVCRRRKVRCGREQPECANCVRMKQNCVYQALVHDDSGRAHPASPLDKGINKPDTQKELSWSHWVPRESNIDNATGADEPSTHPNQPSAHPGHRPPPQQSVEPLSTVPSWEEAIQISDFHDATAAHHHSPAITRNSSPVPSAPPLPTESGFLSLRRGARSRYMSQTFWGFVVGKESLTDDFFDENRHARSDLPLPHISSLGMFSLLRSLPNKPVSDALLEMFFVAVWPLVPLFHPPELQAQYDEFWEWCRNNETSSPPEKLRDDPTFICLLFAILYCGASAAPASSWTHIKLQGLGMETTVTHLKSAYTTSLSLCQHLKHPTINTLTSSLLADPFLGRPSEPMHDLIQLSTMIRIAQIMGLHREVSWSALTPIEKETRRRVWWHIVWLDVQSSISTGLTLCCGNDALEAVRMVGTIDEETSNSAACSPLSDSATTGQSVAILYAIGRFQTARLQARIIRYLHSSEDRTQDGFEELVIDAKQLSENIESLIARVPILEIPEKGCIPSCLANAAPYTHPSLYKEDASQPTVFTAWARIMLTLLKSEIAILLQKASLLPPDSQSLQSHKSWTRYNSFLHLILFFVQFSSRGNRSCNLMSFKLGARLSTVILFGKLSLQINNTIDLSSITRICVDYLRIYLQLYQSSSFSPYVWFCCGHYVPLQCAFIAIIYLHHFEDSSEASRARYCTEETIHHWMAEYQAAEPGSSSLLEDAESNKDKKRMPLNIQVLIDLHENLGSSLEPNDRPPRLDGSRDSKAS
ncbi:hypothetical protein N7488_008558 [Penicillium malachiteum]|nr:hypothetical protein N7488_008558 [Penicillium malachiteum]